MKLFNLVVRLKKLQMEMYFTPDLYIDEKDNEVTFDYEQNKQTHNSGIPHTMIKMTNVKTDLTIENLIKHLKVVCYLHLSTILILKYTLR